MSSKSIENSGFCIVAIEAIWPNNEGDEASLDYLDLSYLSQRSSPKDESPDVYLGSLLETDQYVDSDSKPSFLSDTYLYFYNPGANVFPTYYIYPNLEDFLKFDSNPVSAFNSVNTLEMDEFSSISGSFFLQTGEEITLNTQANEEERSVVPVITHLLNPRKLKSSSYYQQALDLINNFDANKGSMSTDYAPGIRPIFIRRIQELLEAAKYEEIPKDKPALKPNGLYPKTEGRPDFNGLLKNSEDAHKKRRGYFKIVPLNITQVNTSSSIAGEGEGFGGSTFSISFTLDDLLIIADPYASQQISSYVSNAVPVNQSNYFYDVFNNISREDLSSLYKEVVSSKMSAFRVSGVNFPFNIEDAVEGNDTVTVWMYHDPKEFSFVKETDSSSLRDMTESFVTRKDFSYVVGNLSRKSQDDINLEGQVINSSQRILRDSEVLSSYINPSVSGNFSERENPSVEEQSKISALEVFSIIRSTGDFLGLNVFNEGLRLNPRSSEDFIQKSEEDINAASVSLLPDDTSTLSRSAFVSLVKSVFIPEINLQENSIDPTQYIVPIIAAVETTLTNTSTREDAEVFWRNFYLNENIPTVAENPPTYGTFVGLGSFQQIYGLINPLSSKVIEEANRINERNSVSSTSAQIPSEKSGFFNKRTMLSTYSHGETPYLALKGHISSITSSYGTSSGAHLVTIKGSGYEKLLKDNQVYYEDLFYPSNGGQLFSLTEVFTFYLNMLPPTAITHFISTHLPKFIMIGYPTYTFNDMKNSAIQALTIRASLETEDSEVSTQLESIAENIDTEGNSLVSEELITDIQGNNLSDEADLVDDFSIATVISDLYKNKKQIIRGQTVIDANDLNGTAEGGRTFNIRLFYPVNYLNMTRMKEMSNILIKAYEEDPSRANILSPISIKSNSSIENNIASFNGPQIINQLFTDETGRLRQRSAFEAWERTPDPQYSPTISDEDIINAKFTRDSNSVLNMVDIRPYFGGNTLADAQFAGRALADGNDYIPFISVSEDELDESSYDNETASLLRENFYEVISEPFFRYGKKYKRIERDIYAKDTLAAKRKSILIQRFYGKPLKNAEITITNDTSYRVGETVLVNLSHSRHRSKEIIDVQKTIDWLEEMENNKTLMDMYIGVDTRFLNYESYYKTSNLNEDYRFSYWLKDFINDPKLFILQSIKKTLEYVKERKAVYITPEFFPNVYWAFTSDSSKSIAEKFNPNLTNEIVLGFYNLVFKNLSGTYDLEISNMLKEYPQLINILRFQNFRSTSYYIKGVNHSYTHGSDFSTRLSLTHGQDNLVILEPFSMKPIGFMSVEKKMRIGYDDIVVDYTKNEEVYKNTPLKGTKDRLMWEDFSVKKLSPTQRMYIEQFNEERKFKELSFLYNSQKYRTSSNFMYKLSLELGL